MFHTFLLVKLFTNALCHIHIFDYFSTHLNLVFALILKYFQFLRRFLCSFCKCQHKVKMFIIKGFTLTNGFLTSFKYYNVFLCFFYATLIYLFCTSTVCGVAGILPSASIIMTAFSYTSATHSYFSQLKDDKQVAQNAFLISSVFLSVPLKKCLSRHMRKGGTGHIKMKRAELVGHPAHPGWICFSTSGGNVGNESSAVIGPILLS